MVIISEIKIQPLSVRDHKRAHETYLDLLEEMHRGDAWALHALRSFSSPERFFRQLFDGNTAAWVAADGANIIGIAIGTSAAGVGRLEFLGIAATYRRCGVGTRILQAVEQDLARRGCHKLEVFTTKESDVTSFYERRGFLVVATLERHYFRRDYDYMTRLLTDPSRHVEAS